MTPTYTYPARLVSIHDGDTVTVEIDLGFNIRLIQTIRLLGINAPELNTLTGKASLAAITTLAWETPDDWPLTVTTVKDRADKYGGRMDANIILADGTDVGKWMIAKGWAKAWSGDGPKPV